MNFYHCCILLIGKQDAGLSEMIHSKPENVVTLYDRW